MTKSASVDVIDGRVSNCFGIFMLLQASSPATQCFKVIVLAQTIAAWTKQGQ
ncbi:MAG: hypothetical protein ICV66_03655 [Chitinophagaceae bacterium]|nr:hypothetical protein [Chitinophagaceae bacterium]